MKKKETRVVTVYYCDICGDEITGTKTTVNNLGEPDKHACHGWIEGEQTRCDLKLKAEQSN